MFNKRAQGLSITVIVAAVIGLIIIVVLVMMLTGKLGGFSKGVDAASGDVTKNCAEIGGSLLDKDNCPQGKNPVVTKDSIATGKLCCK